jgi:hypothetical protein
MAKFVFHCWGSQHNPDPKFRGWWLLVDNDEVFEYVYQQKARSAGEAFYGMFEAKDLMYSMLNTSRRPIEGTRHSTKAEYLANLALGRHERQIEEKEGKERRIGLVEAAWVVENTFCGPMAKMYAERGKIYVNKCGGFCNVESMEHYWQFLGTKEVEECIFPEPEDSAKTDYEVYKWAQGRHWYAKVGGKDVVIDGKQCWKTVKDAEDAVKKFAKENGFVVDLQSARAKK